MSEQRILNRFLRQVLRDRVAGGVKSLESYQGLFPGAEDLIAEQYEEAVSGTGGVEPTVLEGREFGSYRIEELLGRGGQAAVYLATDQRLGRKVALKILDRRILGSSREMLRFRREAEVASQLAHPGICTVYEAGVERGTPFIAMEAIEGENLASKIARSAESRTPATLASISLGRADGDEDTEAEKPPSEPSTHTSGREARAEVTRIATLVEKVARALHAAHEAGVLHRDIKPANIMVDADERPVITDFGLARQEDSDLPTLTRSGELFGTPAYMSPEQLTRQAIHLDRRSDIWSLGATLYECLTLQRPFAAPTREGLYQAILTSEPPDVRRRNPAIGRDLAVVVQTALQKSRDRRYQTALDLAEDLGAVREGKPIHARPVPIALRALRWVGREPAKAVAAVALLAAVAVAGYLVARWSDLEEGRAAKSRAQVEVLVGEGFLELDHGRGRVSRRAFERALELDPTSIPARAGAALACVRVRDTEAAQRVLDAGGEEHTLPWIQGMVLEAQGRAGEARRLMRGFGAPRDAMEWFVQSRGAFHMGHLGSERHFGIALDCLQGAIMSAEAPRALFFQELAHAAGHVGERAICNRAAAALVHHWPDDPVSRTWAGFALLPVGPRRALKHLDIALELDDQRPLTHFTRGQALARLERLDEAIASYRTAVDLDEEMAAAWGRLGVALARQERFDAAEAALDRAIDLAPADHLILRNRGLVARMQGELPEAERFFRAAMAADRKSHEAWYDLIDALRHQGRLDEAVATAREALDHVRDKASIYDRLGVVLEERGDTEGALNAYERALELGPRNSFFHNNVTSVLWSLGREGDALHHLERSIELDASNRIAWTNLDALYAGAEPQWIDGDELSQSRERARGLRFPGAVIAARAGTGKLRQQRLGAELRAEWRAQALSWLRQDLAAWRSRLEIRSIREARLVPILERWQRERWLDPLRESAALEALPAAERSAWAAFWSEVEDLILGLE